MSERDGIGRAALEWVAVVVVTWIPLSLLYMLFGYGAALYVGSVAFAYCVGVLYGAGSQIRKQEARPAGGREGGA